MRCVSCGFVRLALIAALVVAPRAYGASAMSEMAAMLASAAAPEGLRTVWQQGSEDPTATLDRLERA